MDSFVLAHLKGVSRTYAIVIPMLPRGLSDAVGLGYLLMRVVDTFEDDPQLADADRADCLTRLDDLLVQNAWHAPPPELCIPRGANAAERALMADLPRVWTALAALDPNYRDAIVTCARAMISGVREFLARAEQRGLPYPAIRDAAELRRYCYFVAGVVGEMLCAMFAHSLRQPALLRMRELAVELGVGLQLVNILKDALKDSHDGRRYLPLAAGGGVSSTEIYRAVLAEARQSLQRGVDFVLALPATAREVRSFCGLPIAWGAMTLARAERRAAAAKVGRSAIASSIRRFAQLAGDDGALRQWFDSMLHPSRARPGFPTR